MGVAACNLKLVTPTYNIFIESNSCNRSMGH